MLSRVRWLRPAGIVLLLAGLCGVPLHGLAEAPASLAERIMEAGLADDSAKLAELKVQAPDVPKPKSPGNRKLARKLNSAGVTALSAGDPSSAVSLLKQAAEADAIDVEVVNNLGYAMVRAGNYGDAKQVLSHALQLVPGRSAAWMNLGEAHNHTRGVVSLRQGYIYHAIHMKEDQ